MNLSLLPIRILFLSAFCLLASAFTAAAAQTEPEPAAKPPEESPATRDGKKKGTEVAQALIQLGDPYLLFGWRGLAGSFQFEFPENLPIYLEKKLGIKCLTRATPFLEEFDQGYAETFNQAMLAHFELKHGKGFFYKAEEAAAAIEGHAAALKELAAGRLALETYGLPSRSRGAYIDILKEKYGIQLRMTAGCIVNSTITGHARGFNETMMAEITKRFGPDALAQAEKEAETRYREQ